jgi:hypothetical protein
MYGSLMGCLESVRGSQGLSRVYLVYLVLATAQIKLKRGRV